MKTNYFAVALIVALGSRCARADVTPAQRAEMKAHLDKAQELMKGRDPLQALDDLNAIIALKLDAPETVEALIAHGRLDMENGGAWGVADASDAVKEFTQAIEMVGKVTDGGPNSQTTVGEAYRYRGLAQSAQLEWKKAVADFDAALKINPNDVESLIGRGEANTHFGLGLFSDVKEKPAVEPLDDFAAALKIDPKSAHAYVARGLFNQGTLFTVEGLQKALPDYEKAVQVDPNYAEGWYYRGMAREHLAMLSSITGGNSDSKVAKSDYDRAIALQPKADYFTTRARLMEHQYQPDYAPILADYTSAIQYDAANPSRYTNRAAAQASSPHPDKAQMLADYTQAIKLLKSKQDDFAMMAAFGAQDTAAVVTDVELGRAQQKRGDLELEKGDLIAALTDFNDALKNVPTDNDALAGRGLILVAAGKPEMAIQEISARMAHIRHDENESLAKKLFGARGRAFLATKRYDEALLDLNQAIKEDSMLGFKIYSKNADWYLLRSLAWSNKGDNAHALADLNVAAKLNPSVIEKVKGTEFEHDLKPRDPDATIIIENGDTPILHKLKGNEWAAAGSPANAASEFDKAIALDPNYADAYNNRGLAWMQLENFDSAERDMNKAIELKVDDPRFYINRSRLRFQQQRAADAIADAQKATQLDATQFAFWDALATAQQLKGDYAAVEVSLNSALKLAGDNKSQQEIARTMLVFARAVQNYVPTAVELAALFAVADNDDLQYLLRASAAELTRHPEATALNDLRTTVTAQLAKLKAKP